LRRTIRIWSGFWSWSTGTKPRRAEALLHYAIATREGGWGAGYESYVGHLAWQVMAESGHFPAHVPATLRGAKRSRR
jgi:hypothetical protein